MIPATAGRPSLRVRVSRRSSNRSTFSSTVRPSGSPMSATTSLSSAARPLSLAAPACWFALSTTVNMSMFHRANAESSWMLRCRLNMPRVRDTRSRTTWVRSSSVKPSGVSRSARIAALNVSSTGKCDSHAFCRARSTSSDAHVAPDGALITMSPSLLSGVSAPTRRARSPNAANAVGDEKSATVGASLATPSRPSPAIAQADSSARKESGVKVRPSPVRIRPVREMLPPCSTMAAPIDGSSPFDHPYRIDRACSSVVPVASTVPFTGPGVPSGCLAYR